MALIIQYSERTPRYPCANRIELSSCLCLYYLYIVYIVYIVYCLYSFFNAIALVSISQYKHSQAASAQLTQRITMHAQIPPKRLAPRLLLRRNQSGRKLDATTTNLTLVVGLNWLD